MKTILFCILFIPLQTVWANRQDSGVLIPAGAFQMGCSMGDELCGSDEGPAGGIAVQVDAFRIDDNEVTVAAYRQCVKAGQCRAPEDTSLTQYCNYGNPARDNHPVNCLDWQQAQNYCTVHGGRLPYEAEWEKAARAGSLTAYPWGNIVSCKQAILDDGKTTGSVPDEGDGCGEDRTWPIASRPANAFGLHDMHGNAGEWVFNWYAPDAISELYSKGNLSGPVTGRQRVLRGGSWDENPANLRSSYRNVKPPESGKSIYGSIGFRCVYPQ